MEVLISDITDVEKEVQIVASAAELTPHIEEAYKRYQPKVEIKGFRKGKAPFDLIKRFYGESIEYGELDTIASDLYRQVVKERDIQPMGEPVLTDINYQRGEKLTFKVKYEIRPTIELKDYKGIPLEKMIHNVTDKEIQDEVERIRNANHTKKGVDTVVDLEHVVTVDIQKLDETGNPLIGEKNNDTQIYLANETIYPEIREALMNCKVGDIRRVKIERDHEGHKHTDHLEIAIKQIEKIILPEYDDDFVKKITKEKKPTVEQFQGQLRQDIEDYWRDLSERRLTDNLMNEIVRRHEFNVPESLVKGILNSFIEDMKNQSTNKKLPVDFDEEKYREKNRPYAIFQAKWFLIRERIIEAERLTVEDTELEQLADVEASKVGIEKDRLIKFYKTSSSVKEKILTDKLMALLKSQAKITEKVTEDFVN